MPIFLPLLPFVFAWSLIVINVPMIRYVLFSVIAAYMFCSLGRHPRTTLATAAVTVTAVGLV